jgi:hypothetical protein
VAIIYTHPIDTTTQLKNDIYYIQSLDGVTWDWVHGKVNVTHYGQGGDSLYAYSDLDAVYDYNDDLHITWNAQWVTADTIYDRVFLYHYDIASGAITQMTWLQIPQLFTCAFGLYNLAINKMSLAADSSSMLFATYTRFDTSDCSADGLANGEIYMQYSRDGGATWSGPEDLTNSHTPGCVPGTCASDIFPSTAERANDYLHTSYFCDTRGQLSSLLYLPVYTPPLAVTDNHALSRDFSLSQNYPNPFNARTTIEFDLKRNSQVRLCVYDVTGALVRTLVDGQLAAGPHKAVWNAGEMASGVYYYRMTAGGESQVKKMILLK